MAGYIWDKVGNAKAGAPHGNTMALNPAAFNFYALYKSQFLRSQFIKTSPLVSLIRIKGELPFTILTYNLVQF